MSKGGGGSTTSTVQKADPWVGVQPGLSALYSNALNWYNGSGPQYYPGQTVAPQDHATLEALDAGQHRAENGSKIENMTRAGIFDTGAGSFLNSNPGNDMYRRLAAGTDVNWNPAALYYENSSSGKDVMSNPANSYFSQEAAGKWLDKSNPYLDAMYKSATNPLVNQFQNAIAPSIASQFSAAGRFGSGAHQSAITSAEEPLGQALATTSANLYGHAYDTERQLQQQGASSLAANFNFERGLQQQSTNALSDIYTGGQQRLGAAAAGLSSNYGAERQLMSQAQMFGPQAAAMDYADLDKLLGIGQYREGYNQNLIGADMARYDYGQNQPLNKLQALNQLLQGGAAYSGSSSTGSSQQARNPFAGMLGGAIAGNALGGSLGAMQLGGFAATPLGPVGMGLGALAGLFM